MEATGYEKPKFLGPILAWAVMGEQWGLLCEDCKSKSCYGCPVCWREFNGEIEYFRQPLHGYARA